MTGASYCRARVYVKRCRLESLTLTRNRNLTLIRYRTPTRSLLDENPNDRDTPCASAAQLQACGDSRAIRR